MQPESKDLIYILPTDLEASVAFKSAAMSKIFQKMWKQIREIMKFTAHFQAPQGAVQKGIKYFNKTTKWTKRNQIHLVYQMWQRICENMKMLPFEQGPPHQDDWFVCNS